MANDRFVYVTYIRTTPEKLWEALLTPEFTRQYWFGVTLESDWKVGASWKMVLPDGTVVHDGEILEFEPEKRLVFRWRGERSPEMRAEGYSRCAMEIEEVPSGVKLTVLHEIDRPESKLIEDVSGGWPMILSNLKSLLETGDPMAGLLATRRSAA
ncbi:SRPBCC family protein [Hyphomicrobium sp.]|uniref:SRPBCC family protein n=1 Tax=Hyphomicrobium sp. TaxID=82 RepID=UPI000FBDEA22|nr:SRPBCC family protein [Hyphomicrobium sp.]RUO98338.1 MAG: ATPase [Hyphomicrobium sp.]